MQFRNKRIVLTGGTSGIGRQLVEQLAEDNELIVLSRPSQQLRALREAHPAVEIFEVDLADGAAVTACGDALVQRFQRIDVLINNAAVQNTPTFLQESFDYESIESEIAVNLTSPCQLVAKLLPALCHAPEALIVNINSGLGLVPKTSSAIYCATKGGLNIFSKALANQLEATNVSVRQVFLPLVDTAMTRGRGSGKLSDVDAAERIIRGLVGNQTEINIGKVKLLRLLARFVPVIAKNIMKTA